MTPRGTIAAWALSASLAPLGAGEEADLAAVRALEERRIAAIERAMPSVIAIYPKQRGGGGSGVIFDADGFGLTNHHVIEPVGTEGLGGIADGKLYRLTLIGTDPGGDVALVRLHGRERFPAVPLGDGARVRAGQWALAMGNPFTLAEDQRPTVTFGIVSGIDRYQSGQGNVGIYGNCIQLSASINPGNSGGPLFDLDAHVLGINGRGSFEERGRVNVGVGYAISIEQVKNFLGDLRATKICQHGTVDAVFRNRDGTVICGEIDRDGVAAQVGLDLGDRLLSFDGVAIRDVNQFAGLQSTMPAGWPVEIVYEHAGERRARWLRLRALPYAQPARAKGPRRRGEDEERAPAWYTPIEGRPGEIRDVELNRAECARVLARWRAWALGDAAAAPARAWRGQDELLDDAGAVIARCEATLAADGRWRVLRTGMAGGAPAGAEPAAWGYDGRRLWQVDARMGLGDLDPRAAWMPEPGWLMAIAATLAPRGAHDGATPLAGQAWSDVALEGGDRVQRQRVDRLGFALGARGERAWCCFSLLDEDGSLAPRLLKIVPPAADRDAADAWVLRDVRAVGGARLPHARTLVRGLDERAQATARTTWAAAPLDDALFAPPARAEAVP